MEALNFLKFWKPTTTFPSPVLEVDNEVDDDEEEEDSFFDLELSTPDFDNKKKNPDEKTTKETESLNLEDEERVKDQAKTSNSRELCYPKPSLSLSPIDSISKRKILPLEPINPKPQSPIALLKSAPTFRVFMFKKSKSRGTGETESNQQQNQEGKLFTVKFNVDEAEASNVSNSKLTRESSSRRTTTTRTTEGQEQSSKNSTKTEQQQQRFSKDVIQKYLKLVKPLYVKVSKRYNEKTNPTTSDLFLLSSPASSPAVSVSSMALPKDKSGTIPAGIRTVCKHLGKSKSSSSSSSSSACTAQAPANRRDDSLLQQHDGIQSAILHCKRSFNSSRGISLRITQIIEL